jgi:acetylornithine deacetylase/succinyl-diaminopimelate desuccinylase-like protein
MHDAKFSKFIEPEELAATALMLANTFSPTLHEQPMAEAVFGWLEANKLNPVKQPILADRTNVYAVLKGSGGGASLIFNSHMDSEVSGPDYDWAMAQPDINKAGAWREGNRLFGHTVLNDRGLMATTMIVLKALRDSGVELAGDVIFTGVVGETGNAPVDEWQGAQYQGKGFGSRHLVAHGVRADCALVAETTDFGISWFACGASYLKISVPGRNIYTPRSFRPEDIREHPNAIVKMARVIDCVEEWARGYEAAYTYQSPCGKVIPKVNIGAVRGGIPYRPNRTSPYCAIYVDVRTLPGADPLALQRELQSAVDRAGVGAKVETFMHYGGVEGQNTQPLAEAVRDCYKRVSGNDPLPEAPTEVVSMWRDNNVFNLNGIPSVTFGLARRKEPGSGRLCFEIDDLALTANVYAELAYAICGKQKS